MRQQILLLSTVIMLACNSNENKEKVEPKIEPTLEQKTETSEPPQAIEQPKEKIVFEKSNQPLKPVELVKVNNTQTNDVKNIEIPTVIEPKNTLTAMDIRTQFNEVVKEEKHTLKIDGINEIKTQKGSIITINKSDLITESGKEVTGPVEIKVLEMQNAFDMLAMQSPTISDGKMLESGGSWYINATSNGENLKMKANKSFTLSAANLNASDYKVFYGENTSEGINWKPTDQNFLSNSIKTSNLTKTTIITNSKNGARFKTIYNDESFQKGRGFDGSPTKSYINYNDERVLCNELYEINKNGVYKVPINKNGGFNYLDGKTFELEDLTAKQIEYLKNLIEQSDVNDRCKILRNSSKKPITYQLVLNQSNTYKQIIIDSFVTTDDCKNFPKEIKKLLRNKMEAFCRTPYFKGFQELVQTSELNESTKMLASITNFGWINCDRFYASPAPQIICKTTIKAPKEKAVKVYLAFKKINSLMVGYPDENGFFCFRNIPEGEEVMAIALGSDGEKSYFGKSNYVVTNRNQPIDFSIASVSNSDLKNELTKLKP